MATLRYNQKTLLQRVWRIAIEEDTQCPSLAYTHSHIIHRYVCAYIHTHIERLLGHFQWLIYTYPLPSTLFCSLQRKMWEMHQQAVQCFNQWKARARDQRVKTQWSQGAYSLDIVQQVPTGCLHPCLEGCLPLGSAICDISVSLVPYTGQSTLATLRWFTHHV